MKLSRIISLGLIGSVVLISPAIGQTDTPQPGIDHPQSVAAARCQYTPTADDCSNANDLLAQVPRRGPGPPPRPRRPPVGRSRGYGRPWMEPNRGHVVIGALIGFGLGAAVGAKGSANQQHGVSAGVTFAFGGIGALLGAAIGAGTPPMYARGPRHRAPAPAEEDQQASNRRPDGRTDLAPASGTP